MYASGKRRRRGDGMGSEKARRFCMLLRLFWMNLLGCNPKNQTTFRKIVCFCYLMGTAFISVLMLMKLALDNRRQVGYFAADVVMTFGCIQICVKFYNYLTKSVVMSGMIDTILHDFWPVEDEGLAGLALRRTIQNVLRFSKAYGLLVTLSISGYTILVTLSGEKRLIMDVWFPNQLLKTEPYYQLFYTYEFMVLYEGIIFLVVQHDMLFAAILSVAYIQLRMIKMKLSRLGTAGAENRKLIKTCVEHHNRVLDFLAEIEKFYSIDILLIVSSSFFLATLSMYAVYLEPEYSQKVVFFAIFNSVSIQMGLYCLAGQFIQDEAWSIADTAYFVNWYDIADKDVRFSLIMIIRKSQGDIRLTIGGFFMLCLKSYTSIMRASLSFLTFIINARNNN